MFTSENNPARNDKRANEAVELYNTGLSFSQVAKLLGGTRQSIYDMCRLRAEYKPRRLKPAEYQYFNGVKYTLRNHGYYGKTTGKRTLMHRDVWEYYNGKIQEGFDIHHIDHDKANNTIENLELYSKPDHTRLFSTGRNQFTRKKAV